jgi:hypothetical protein
MKKLFLALFVLTASVAFCQTTPDEYNYLRQGYGMQLTSGGDMKAGYTMVDKGTTPDNSITVGVRYLYRTNGNVFAGGVLIVNGLKNGKSSLPTQYFVIPAAGSDMNQWNSAMADIRQACGNDKSGYEAIMFAFMHAIP